MSRSPHDDTWKLPLPLPLMIDHEQRAGHFLNVCMCQDKNPSSGSRYHRVCIALDEEISLPCISIDNRAFAFSIVDALWLIENLQIAGYLAAMADE
ncbi:hypothetical protein [Pseudomonas sp. RIT623]|uniref:hypothetical protein n=1 Tax=Pseudomonas sp. RIT623 TaxID=2559075 RepID=UPI0010701343|nr:hypothetical protein [Pseudomonas sp. RIT623]TFF41755.1 hypothetical protein E3U47_08400 [Pseudomonas sp. RIT623]